MITDVLLEHPWLSPTALAFLVVLGPWVGAGLVPRTRLSRVLTAASLLPVAALTLVPVDRTLSAGCAVQWALPTPSRVELFANLVLFVPPALLAGVATRRPAVALVAVSALAAAIEALQAVAPAIGRSCDTGDWLCNTMGAAVGALLAATALWVARRRGRSAHEPASGRGTQPYSAAPAPGTLLP